MRKGDEIVHPTTIHQKQIRKYSLLARVTGELYFISLHPIIKQKCANMCVLVVSQPQINLRLRTLLLRVSCRSSVHI